MDRLWMDGWMDGWMDNNRREMKRCANALGSGWNGFGDFYPIFSETDTNDH
jgi:hypothetical protein